MSTLNGREVTLARLHAATHVTDLGNMGPVIDSKNNTAMKSGKIALTYLDGGVLVTDVKTKKQAIIPAGNIQSLELAPEKNS